MYTGYIMYTLYTVQLTRDDVCKLYSLYNGRYGAFCCIIYIFLYINLYRRRALYTYTKPIHAYTAPALAAHMRHLRLGAARRCAARNGAYGAVTGVDRGVGTRPGRVPLPAKSPTARPRDARDWPREQQHDARPTAD